MQLHQPSGFRDRRAGGLSGGLALAQPRTFLFTWLTRRRGQGPDDDMKVPSWISKWDISGAGILRQEAPFDRVWPVGRYYLVCTPYTHTYLCTYVIKVKLRS